MQRRAVEVREVRIRFVEDQREVGSRESDGIDAVAFKDRMGEGRQSLVLLFGANPNAQQFEIGLRNILHLLRPRADDLDIANQTIKAGFHHLSTAKNADPSNLSRSKLVSQR